MNKLKFISQRLSITISTLLVTMYLSATDICAVVVINEIYPNPPGNEMESGKEWVELYNNGSDTVSLVGWYLIDKSNKKEILSGLGEILSDGFVVLETDGGWLNNADEEKVHLYNGQDVYVDGYTFNNANEDGITWGRYPDGQNWDRLQSETKGSANNFGFSTPTPKPSSTPSPSATATLTSVPTVKSTVLPPTLTPTPKFIVKESTDLTPTRIQSVTKRQTVNNQPEQTETTSDVTSLREKVLSVQASDEVPEASGSSVKIERSFDLKAYIFLGTGVIFLLVAGVGIFLNPKMGKRAINWKTNN